MAEKKRQRAISDYAARINESGLSPPLQFLAGLNLHDARILAAKFDAGKGRLYLRVQRGDLQHGYFSTSLAFSETRIGASGLKLLREASKLGEYEVLATELGQDRHGLEFRLLLWPKGEIAVRFKGVRMRTMAASDR